MPCERIGTAIVCSNKIIECDGFKIEYPQIGCPVMLDGDLMPVNYEDTPKEFWDAVKNYQKKPLKGGKK